MRLARAIVVVALAAGSACTGEGSGEDAGASTSTGEPASTTGVETASNTLTTGLTTNGFECLGLDDEFLATSVTITLRNDGALPVAFVVAADCHRVEPLVIRGPDSVLPSHWLLDACEVTCGRARAGLCRCDEVCPEDRVVVVAPGGAYPIVWDGRVYSDGWLPALCTDAPECVGPCQVQRAAGAGRYRIEAVAGTEVADCVDPDACECAPNREGWCEVAASAVAGESREAMVSIDYPGEVDALLVFE